MKLGRILGNTIKQPQKKCPEISPDILAVKQAGADLLSNNLASLQTYTETAAPKAVIERQKLVEEMEKLAQIAKSAIR